MIAEIVNRVKKQLNSEFYFMNDNWLFGCVEYFVTESQNAQPNMKEVLEFVRAQWLLSDLREINTDRATLPSNLAAKKLIVLPGSYTLQVNEMIDISQSKYKQLQSIRKESTLNVEVTEEDNLRETGREPKIAANRMIHLKMTDGVQNIVGMEYTPIPLLNEMLLPGYKILIKGPVKCRNGVLFLKEANIQGRGGEVDRLLIPNALENLLARALNMPENPDPYNDNVEATGEVVNSNPNSTPNPNPNSNPNPNRNPNPNPNPNPNRNPDPDPDPDVEALLSDGDFDINMDEIAIIENSYMQNASSGNTRIAEQPAQRIQRSSANNVQAKVSPVEEYAKPPYITEPGGEDDDTFAVCNEFDVSNVPVVPAAHTSNEENRSSISHNVPRSKIKTPFDKGPLQSSKQQKEDSRSVERLKQYNFLRDILQEKITGTKTIDVMAHIAKMSRLSKHNSCWTFNCTIADDTGSMDVSFTNEVLEKVIGLTVSEFSQKKKKKKDPQVYQELQRVLSRAERTLQTINIVKIKMKEGEKPEVLKVSELTEAQKKAIEERLNQS